jgi:hypothetical protein
MAGRKIKSKGKRRGSRSEVHTKHTGGLMIVRDYHDLAFKYFATQVQAAGRYSEAPSPLRSEFWLKQVVGTYPPDDGRKLVEEYLRIAETELQNAVAGNSIAYWLHLLRRLAPMAVGVDRAPATISLTRTAMEAAVQKCSAAKLCHRIGISTEVPSSAILNGALLKIGDTDVAQRLLANPQLVLTDFGVEEFAQAVTVEKLAFEVWWSMSLLRILGKGAPLIVTGDPDSPVIDGRSNELDFLLRNYDARQGGFTATATATVFEDAFRHDSEGIVFLPRYNVHRVTFDVISPFFERLANHPFFMLGRRAAPNFLWLPFNIKSFLHAHLPFGTAFQASHGVTLESVIAVIATMAHETFASWIRQPERCLLRSWQRAYEGPLRLDEYVQHIANVMPSVTSALGLEINPEEVFVRRAVDFLTLDGATRNQIGVSYSGPHSVFLPCGTDRVLVDMAYLFSRLYHLFHGLEVSDQNFKGRALENAIPADRTVLSNKQLFANDGSSRQVDAAIAIGEILLIVECRANSRSIAFDRGMPAAIARRREIIESALNDIDDKAAWLKKHPKGSRHDLTRFGGILPIGVTPFPEFIHSRMPRYWLDSWLPRVLSLDELRDALENGSLARAAKNCLNVVRLK